MYTQPQKYKIKNLRQFVNSLKKKGLQFRFKLIYIIDRSNVNRQIVPEDRGNDGKSP